MKNSNIMLVFREFHSIKKSKSFRIHVSIANDEIFVFFSVLQQQVQKVPSSSAEARKNQEAMKCLSSVMRVRPQKSLADTKKNNAKKETEPIAPKTEV